MRKRAKNFLITTERHELVIVRSGKLVESRGFCLECNAEVDYMTFDAATGYSGLSGRDLIRLIESGEVHSCDAMEGRFAICMQSLAKEKEECE